MTEERRLAGESVESCCTQRVVPTSVRALSSVNDSVMASAPGALSRPESTLELMFLGRGAVGWCGRREAEVDGRDGERRDG